MTLLETLEAVGILPDDRAAAARVMLGRVARPGEGGDALFSKIELGTDGSVLANGQRLR